MQVASLHCYPIKGCRGHSLATVELDSLGVVDDRRLMLVDAANRFISQREEPLLATIEPSLRDGVLSVRRGTAAAQFEISSERPVRDVTLWGSSIRTIDQGDGAAEWFSDALGTPCRLVHFGPGSRRAISPAFSPRADAQTAFTDGYPVLGVLQESLDDLNTRLAESVPMARFRPNVVVQGASAWSEDAWRTLRAGSVTFDAVKPCARCVVPTTDQLTGARHPGQEPLRTLVEFRMQKPFGAIFGQNLVPRDGGTITVGDPVTMA